MNDWRYKCKAVTISAGIITIGAFLIYLLVITITQIQQDKDIDCDKYPYVCRMRSSRTGDGCTTVVYHWSKQCLDNGTRCQPLIFKNCDECGEYQFSCSSFGGDKCPREGLYACGYYEQITNNTNEANVCYPNTLESVCPNSNKIGLIVGLSILVIGLISWIGFVIWALKRRRFQIRDFIFVTFRDFRFSRFWNFFRSDTDLELNPLNRK